MSLTMKVLAATRTTNVAQGLHCSDIMTMFMRLCYSSPVAAGMAALSAGREAVLGCSASKKRINVSTLHMVPRVSFQPLSWHLAYTGFSEQCKQDEQ